MWAKFLKLLIELKIRCLEKISNFFLVCTWERKREIQVFFKQPLEFHWLESVEPRIKIHFLDEGFYQRSKGGDLGKSKALGLGGVLEASYLFYYTLRGRVLHTLILPLLFGFILRGLL